MAKLYIKRAHNLDFDSAKALAEKWQQQGEERYDLVCERETSESTDILSFKRSGIEGELRVTASEFELDAELGFLLSVFKEKIISEINNNLDDLLA